MQMRILFVFLMAVALAAPEASAFNCTALSGEDYKVCNYVEGTSWSQSEKDSVIQNMINSGGSSLDGNFNSIMDRPVVDTIQLNKLEEVDLKISEENKVLLIDFSSISIFGYIIYSFLKWYFLLWRFL